MSDRKTSTSPEENDVGGLRDSYLNGRYSFAILIAIFIVVIIGGIAFIAFTGVEYDESKAYLARESFFNRNFSEFIVFQIVPLVAAAALTALSCVSIYEIITGIATPEEREKYKVSLGKSVLLAVVPLAIVVVMIFAIQNWATVLTEEGIEIYRPGQETVCCKWEDTVSFTYEESDASDSPEADITFENGMEVNIDFAYFKRISDNLYEVYERVWEDGKIVMSEKELFFKDIFLDKYGHLNEANSKAGNDAQ